MCVPRPLRPCHRRLRARGTAPVRRRGARIPVPPARRLDKSRGGMTVAVEVRNVRRVFRTRTGAFAPERLVRAVDGVSFTLAAGDVLGIVGESGCGKSTLARVILGLLPASEGDVLVDGRS